METVRLYERGCRVKGKPSLTRQHKRFRTLSRLGRCEQLHPKRSSDTLFLAWSDACKYTWLKESDTSWSDTLAVDYIYELMYGLDLVTKKCSKHKSLIYKSIYTLKIQAKFIGFFPCFILRKINKERKRNDGGERELSSAASLQHQN